MKKTDSRIQGLLEAGRLAGVYAVISRWVEGRLNHPDASQPM